MLTARILIFGGKTDQILQITPLIPGLCPVGVFSLSHSAGKSDLKPVPGLILVIPDESGQKAYRLLSALRPKVPETPILFIAEDPPKEDISEAFRHGIQDYLFFPIQAEKFLEVIEKYLYKKPPDRPWAIVRRWLFRAGGRLKRFRSPDMPGPGSPLVLPPVHIPGDKELFCPVEEKEESHDLHVQFLGRFNIQIKGSKLKLFPGEKINALLAYFLYIRDHPIHRETLLSKFWGCNSPNSARNSLNVATHNIRRHLQKVLPGTDFLQYCNDKYTVNPDLDITTDTDKFHRYWQKGRLLESKFGLESALEDYQKALSFYKGDFLEDIHYEPWCETERDILKETYLLILDRLGAFFFQKKDFVFALKIFKKMLEKDPCLEDVHRKLILSYYKLGLRDKAVKQYYKCAAALKIELNIEPSQPTRELFKLISNEGNIPAILF